MKEAIEKCYTIFDVQLSISLSIKGHEINSYFFYIIHYVLLTTGDGGECSKKAIRTQLKFHVNYVGKKEARGGDLK